MAQQQISDIAAVGAAFNLWKLYGFQNPSELVLEDLALARGVLVIDGRLDSADARLVRKGARGLIRVSNMIAEAGRRRFAIAHELGHWMLHAKLSQMLSCTSEDMVAKYKGSVEEIEANVFAAELLMPQNFFLARIKNSQPSIQLLKQEANFFLTSLTATAIRWIELTDDYCAVVFSENGKIRWWRGSKPLDGRLWLDAGIDLHADSIAGSYFRGNQVASGRQKIEAECWVDDARRLGTKYLFEEAYVMERYGQVMSLLTLP